MKKRFVKRDEFLDAMWLLELSNTPENVRNSCRIIFSAYYTGSVCDCSYVEKMYLYMNKMNEEYEKKFM
jgi:hypothetical protein